MTRIRTSRSAPNLKIPYEMIAKPLATTKVLVAQFLGLLCQLRRHMDHTYRDHQPPSKS